MDLKVESKKAFISGSTQGIGFAIARQLLDEGAEVVLNGREEKKLKRAVEKLTQEYPQSTVTGIAADFSDGEEVNALLSELGDIDILVNNVGVFELKAFGEIADSDWMNMFNINVMSSVRLCRHLLPGMLERNFGRIVFIASESGVNVPANMIHYGMSKAAMLAISNGLSKLTKGKNITVNSILGGPTYSDGVAAAVEQIAGTQNLSVEQMKAGIIQQTNPDSLLQRFIDPSEIASLAAYLASPLSIATNGASLRADGGVLRQI
ncbi:NAD(P)-dependent dehydrogenase, short-chain alcohol dehydrogenase family [Algoriphagus locisalis]|uniref:NAD(P)-dependent dehydrogenase, short-chain alcohol dehydrogenase family n=1 Tax=Algoriphagus locisalis TaxID=305507 RepID=A0A1I7CB24_9BACT|nr:SDR family NAD(P)-dependent oxidoreductase [Algoriphagus locisalis]SFT96639.1 NAD(P)-dependent dehydrogenase, short-chain alcohol dehydrogenase family [Algoriphagus locisalis]